MKKFNRRDFVKAASMSAATIGLPGISQDPNTSVQVPSRHNSREVLIATFSMGNITGSTMEEVSESAIRQFENAKPMSPDIYCLPETFHYRGLKGSRFSVPDGAENGSGNVIGPFQKYARENNCYIVCPVFTVENGLYYNAAVIIDRKGQYLGEYRKLWLPAEDIEKGISAGPREVPVFKTDFGIIGVQICFDLEYPEGWDQLREKGAEIVFWPSAFNGGKRLAAKALDNRYIVVSSSWQAAKIVDVSGELAATSPGPNAWGVMASINLERAVFHTNSARTVSVKFPDIRKKYGRKLSINILGEESCTIIESLSPEVKIADVMKEFNLRTYNQYLRDAAALSEGTRRSSTTGA
jgi:predicted amidohydrolase